MRGRRPASGFTLIELSIVMLIMALVLAFSVPAIKAFFQDNDLMSATTNISHQLELAREKAIATGTTQQLRFIANYNGTSDYHIWSNSTAYPSWKLPKNITYYWGSGTQNSFRMTSDGRCMDSGLIILQDARGIRDTVSVLTSGMVFVY